METCDDYNNRHASAGGADIPVYRKIGSQSGLLLRECSLLEQTFGNH
jgi:hypothetical protein